MHPAAWDAARLAGLDRAARYLDLRFAEPRLEMRGLGGLGGVVSRLEAVGYARVLWAVHGWVAGWAGRVGGGEGEVLRGIEEREAERRGAWLCEGGREGEGEEWGDVWEVLEALGDPDVMVQVVGEVDLRGR